MSSQKAKIFIISGLLALSFALVGGTALAANGHNNHQDSDDCDKPGWGLGDKNHKHCGPPGGPSTHPVFGGSVHPGHHDNDDDEHEEENEHHGNGHHDDD